MKFFLSIWGVISIAIAIVLLAFIVFADPSKINMFHVFQIVSGMLILNGLIILGYVFKN